MFQPWPERWQPARRRHAAALSILSAILLATASAQAQSGSRSKPITSSKSAPASAKPSPQGVSPFLPPLGNVERLRLAVGGHCVVTLHSSQKWIAGIERHQATFDGRLYWFAGERERAMFVAAPIRYAPVLGGDCPVTFTSSKQRKPGRIEFGLLHQQRLYFFEGSDQQRRFQESPAQYREADLVDQGYCVVSRVDQGRRLPGTPDAVAIVAGLRYRFAGAHQRMVFLNNPQAYGANLGSLPSSSRMAEQSTPGSDSSVPRQEIAEHLSQASPLATAPVSELPLSAPTMLAGFCPVSILEIGLWDRGKQKYRHQYDGFTYLLASEKNQQFFLENPAKYVPALAGNCVVSYQENGQLVSGKNEFTALYQGRLFLFAGAEKKQLFKEDPLAFADVDLANEGFCLVTEREESKRVSGNPLQLAWHQGRRYLFATQDQKDKFLANPEAYVKQQGVNQGEEAEPTPSTLPAKGAVTEAPSRPSYR